jgi:hypothetical protein
MRPILAMLICLLLSVNWSAAEEAQSSGNSDTGYDSTDNLPIAVEKFNAKFSLGLNMKFNFVVYNNNEITANSNAPVFLGFSFGYKDYSLFFSIAQQYTYNPTPGKRAAFDGAITFYQEHWFEEASIKFYDDFKTNDAPFDLQFISGNLLGEYIFNADHFSLQSVYTMNRLQRRSAGSFMAGGNVRAAGIQSLDIKDFNERVWYVSTGPNAGYSYTFVTNSLFFINFFLLAGINAGIELTKPQFVFSVFLMPKIAMGKHFKTWSLNFVLQADYLSFLGGNSPPHTFFNFNSASLGVSKRF